MARRESQAARLERVLRGVSIRGLAKRISEREGVTANGESIRKAITRARDGKQPLGKYEHHVEEELSLPAGYLFEPDVTAARQRELEQRVAVIEARLEELWGALADLRREEP